MDNKCCAIKKCGNVCAKNVMTDSKEIDDKIKDMVGEEIANHLKNEKMFCKKHIDASAVISMNEMNVFFTRDDFKTVKLCGTCRNHQPIICFENAYNTCHICRRNGAKNRANARNNRTEAICIIENCKSKQYVCEEQNEISKYIATHGNEYCYTHLTSAMAKYKKAQAAENKQRECAKNGCHNMLDIDDEFKQCIECRDAEKIKSGGERKQIKEEASKYNVDVNNKDKMCITCGDIFEEFEDVKKVNGKDYKCPKHREEATKQERRRPTRTRDFSAYESRPEVIQRKKDYREQMKKTFPNRCKEYTAIYRQKLRDKLGDEVYNKINTEKHNRYMDNNPDMCLKASEQQAKSESHKYSAYLNRARKRNLSFELSKKQCYKLFKGGCEYCKIEVIGDVLNGIDRQRNNEGYTVDNCVSSCKMCNFLKAWFDVDTFYSKIRHILSFIGVIKEKYECPDAFGDHITQGYEYYKHRAKKLREERGHCEFNLDKNYYKILTIMECYICNKSTTNTNVNGIDRLYNSEGYHWENVMPCCNECNLLKKDYDFLTLITKLTEIHYGRQLEEDEKENIKERVYCHLAEKQGSLFDAFDRYCGDDMEDDILERIEKDMDKESDEIHESIHKTEMKNKPRKRRNEVEHGEPFRNRTQIQRKQRKETETETKNNVVARINERRMNQLKTNQEVSVAIEKVEENDSEIMNYTRRVISAAIGENNVMHKVLHTELLTLRKKLNRIINTTTNEDIKNEHVEALRQLNETGEINIKYMPQTRAKAGTVSAEEKLEQGRIRSQRYRANQK